MPTIGELIKQQRLKAGIDSQSELARLTGIRQAGINEIESGKVDPRWWHLVKIAEVCGVTVSKLVKGVGEKGV